MGCCGWGTAGPEATFVASNDVVASQSTVWEGQTGSLLYSNTHVALIELPTPVSDRKFDERLAPE